MKENTRFLKLNEKYTELEKKYNELKETIETERADKQILEMKLANAQRQNESGRMSKRKAPGGKCFSILIHFQCTLLIFLCLIFLA